MVEDGIKRKRTKWDVMMEGLDRDIAKAAKQEKREKPLSDEELRATSHWKAERESVVTDITQASVSAANNPLSREYA